jgi:hypothetical protein
LVNLHIEININHILLSQIKTNKIHINTNQLNSKVQLHIKLIIFNHLKSTNINNLPNKTIKEINYHLMVLQAIKMIFLTIKYNHKNLSMIRDMLHLKLNSKAPLPIMKNIRDIRLSIQKNNLTTPRIHVL